MNPLLLWFHKLGSPPVFYRVAGWLRPWALALAVLLGAVALYGGLVLAPADYQQGDAYRIIFIHVPCAWMGLFVYGVMAVAAFVALTDVADALFVRGFESRELADYLPLLALAPAT